MTPAQQLYAFLQARPDYWWEKREAIQHHRTQLRVLARCPQNSLIQKAIQSHRQEIQDIYKELAHIQV